MTEVTTAFLSPESALMGSHSRSRSFKSRPRTPRPQEDGDRPRRNSMPSRPKASLLLSSSFNDLYDSSDQNDGEQPLRRVRSFKTTSKGVINRGDSYKRKSKRQTLASHGVVRDESPDLHGSAAMLDARSGGSSPVEIREPEQQMSYRVVVLGPPGVGKTSLTDQFMTSEYIGANGIGSLDRGDEDEKQINVLLDGEESTLVFLDTPDDKPDFDETQVDAFLVIFSSNDKRTFEVSVDIVRQLREEIATDRAIILVANKIDLVRKRLVSADEARTVANRYDCKYAETSAALNHHVDELLVGILSQIRLKEQQVSHNPVEDETEHKKTKERKGSLKIAKGFLSKLFRKGSKRDKSCDNLYEL